MTKFNKGAKVTSAGGAKCIVLSQARKDGAVLIETAPGVKPYRSTYVPAESLTKGHGRVTGIASPKPQVEQAVTDQLAALDLPADYMFAAGTHEATFALDGDAEKLVVSVVELNAPVTPPEFYGLAVHELATAAPDEHGRPVQLQGVRQL